jgi:hypothetical protein
VTLLASVLPGLLLGLSPPAPRPPLPAVAIVGLLRGKAFVTAPPSRSRVPLAVFQRLPAGSQVETDANGTLVLVFWSGRRYSIGDEARCTLGEDELRASRGVVTALSPLPPLPALARIRADERAGSRAAAVRIRGDRIETLHPRHGESAPIAGTVLRFERVADAGRYLLEVRDEAGGTIWQLATAENRVALPPGTLKPETRYSWTVRTLGAAGPVARGEAEFTTLGAQAERERSALKAVLESMGDAPSLALLAEVDRELGLVAEASEGAERALRNVGDDAALRDALQALLR